MSDSERFVKVEPQNMGAICEKRGHHVYTPCAERNDPKTGRRMLVGLRDPGQIRLLQTHRLCKNCGLELAL